MKVSLPVILDCAFSAFISLLLSLILFGSFVPRPYSLVISVTVSLLVAVVAFKFLYKNSKNNLIKKAEKSQFENMLTQFDFSSTQENNEFFCKLFTSLNYSVERKKGNIFFKDKPVAVLIKFGFLDVNKADVVKFFNLLRKNDTGYIISNEVSADVKNFVLRFDGRLIVVSPREIYIFLKERNKLPETRFFFNEKREKGLKLLKNLLYKNKAKNYLVFGLVFLLMSYFFPYKLYYVITGVLFLIASLLSRLFGLSDVKKYNG